MRTQVDVDHLVPRLGGEATERLGRHPAGGVDEAGETAQRGCRLGDRRRQVASHVDHLPVRADSCGDLEGVRGDVPQRHGGAAFDEQGGGGQADAGGSAGHDDACALHGVSTTFRQSALRAATAAYAAAASSSA